ncbi:phage holin family protein [Yersinia entomophaga]
MDKYVSELSCWLGGLTAALGELSLNEWAIIIGIVCKIGAVGVNWHYKRKEFQLKEKSNGSRST